MIEKGNVDSRRPRDLLSFSIAFIHSSARILISVSPVFSISTRIWLANFSALVSARFAQCVTLVTARTVLKKLSFFTDLMSSRIPNNVSSMNEDLRDKNRSLDEVTRLNFKYYHVLYIYTKVNSTVVLGFF